MLLIVAAVKLPHLPLVFRLFPLNLGLGSSKPISILSRTNTSYFSSTPYRNPLSLSQNKAMVTLLVATTSDPASINPANALLAMPRWQPGPHFQDDMKSFVNEGVRLLLHGKSIVAEDDLDKRWEQVTREVVHEVIFFSKHTAVSNKPALTVHPIGVPHLREGDVLPQGGRPGWAALPNPRMGPWLRLLKNIAQAHNVVPEFETFTDIMDANATIILITIIRQSNYFLHKHSLSQLTNFACCICWSHCCTCSDLAAYASTSLPRLEVHLVWEGLGLGGGTDIGNWSREKDNKKILLGIGGGHYAPRHMDVALKDNVWVGHLLSGYSLPMDDPSQSKGETNAEIGGTWRHSIKAAYEATKSAFPGGEILAHLDHKSFKGWQKNAITAFLAEQNIQIGKPNNFY
ncbi:hypothetical protein Fmac_020685 [Flemingia macrophylla]|uniref:D-aminoacyl-tRNA deacylase n=1 Tax=Flemingia macrophylla TaxID=520843 RepID=A0ABD1LV97_9FABA